MKRIMSELEEKVRSSVKDAERKSENLSEEEKSWNLVKEQMFGAEKKPLKLTAEERISLKESIVETIESGMDANLIADFIIETVDELVRERGETTISTGNKPNSPKFRRVDY